MSNKSPESCEATSVTGGLRSFAKGSGSHVITKGVAVPLSMILVISIGHCMIVGGVVSTKTKKKGHFAVCLIQYVKGILGLTAVPKVYISYELYCKAPQMIFKDMFQNSR